MQSRLKSYGNIFFYSFIVIILILGIFLRSYLYFKQIPFWNDERILGIDFFDKNIFDFFFSINPFLKIPPLWGILNHVILNIFGYSFLSFRFVSYVSGILSLFAFIILLKKLFINKIAILTGFLIFSVSTWLIYYSAEFRPYSSDVLICILLLLCYKYISLKKITFSRCILYSIISVFLILFSFPSMFIIPAILLAKSIEEKFLNYKTLLILFSVFFVCLYLYLSDFDCYCFMTDYWQNSFIKYESPFKSFILVCNQLLQYIFNLGDSNVIFIKCFVIIGLLCFFLNKQKEALVFFLIIIFVLSGSIFKIYPLPNRISLYLSPIIIILISKVIDFFSYYNLPLMNKNKKLSFKYSTLYMKFLILINSLFISLLILYLINFNKMLSIANNINIVNYTEMINKRYEYFNLSKSIIEEYNDEIIICPDTIKNSLIFYNKYLKKNKNLHIIFYNCGAVNKEEEEIKILESTLDNMQPSKHYIIIGLFNSWDISPRNIYLVQQELLKYNLNYKKIIYNQFYKFNIL